MRLLTLIFIFSGAAGLIYESIWSRYLGLFVGHSAYAQVIVLVIFLGGMSLGAFAAGERSATLKRPLRAYAYVELTAGLIGLVFHPLYVQLTGAAYDHLFPALAGSGAVPVAKWTASGLMILPQSILLGASFPLMTAAAVRFFPGRPGRDISLLYFGNSFGAAAGVLVAGFVLLRLGGLPGTLLAAAVINIGVFAAALLAERRLDPALRMETATQRTESRATARRKQKSKRDAAARTGSASPRQTAQAGGRPRAGSGSSPRWSDRFFAPATAGGGDADLPLAVVRPSEAFRGRLVPALLAVSFATALASFIYEIAWIRMLSLVLGSTTHAFELMLSAFILGLALGAFAIRSWVDRIRRPVFALGAIQWGMGLLALATLPLYATSFSWLGALQDLFRPTAYGYEGYVLMRYVLCLGVMLPATFCAGMTLPLITRTLLVAGAGERVIGRVYAVNTLGSITGVLLAALVLMPLLGLKLLLAVGALADMAIGALLLFPALRPRFVRVLRPAFVTVAASVAFVAATLWLVQLDRSVLTSGVFRYGAASVVPRGSILFYRDGRTATVSVRHTPEDDKITLATNGKPDASLERQWIHPQQSSRLLLAGDNGTQILLSIVTLAHAPEARTAAVIGQGSGISSHFLLGSPNLGRLVTIEIEPEIVTASRQYYPFNRRVFDDPRSSFVLDDAKSYFSTGQHQFDMILSEPSNPWVSGVSGLFTVEFYRHVRRHLSPGGVFGQWLHLYEMSDAMVLTVLAALDDVFPDYDMYMVAPGDIIIVATTAPRLQPADWDVVNFPAIRADLSRTPLPGAAVFERLWLAGRDVINPMLTDVAANSDFHPVLDLRAERARYNRSRAQGFAGLAQRWFHLPTVLARRRLDFTSDPVSVIPGMPRVDRAAFGAALRRAREAGAGDSAIGASTGALAESMGRLASLERLANSGQSPRSWRSWLEAVAETERDLHFGTMGVADHTFYRTMIEYARTHDAPRDMVASLEYLYGLSAWDFDAVLRVSPILEAAQRQGRPWISVDALRDGTVVGHLYRGDARRARESLASLTPLGDMNDADYEFRTRLLLGAIERLEAQRDGN